VHLCNYEPGEARGLKAAVEMVVVLALIAVVACAVAIAIGLSLNVPRPRLPSSDRIRRSWYFVRQPNVTRGLVRVWLMFSVVWSAFVVWVAPFPLSYYFLNPSLWGRSVYDNNWGCDIQYACILGVSLRSGRGFTALLLAPWIITAAVLSVAWVRRGFQQAGAPSKPKDDA
jgi:hypothetical protein